VLTEKSVDDLSADRVQYLQPLTLFLRGTMLPRFKKIEDEMDSAVARYIRRSSRQHGIHSEIKSHIIHEGKRTGIRRETNEYDATEMHVAQAETQMSYDEIENIDVHFILKKASEISEQFGQHFSKTMFRALDETAERTGQSVDGRGRKLTNELIFEMFEKVQINFEKNKEVGDISIVTSPQMAEAFNKLDLELRMDPVMMKKFNELFERKKNEFREREINRNLVG
jgi:hypothetical protein